MPNAAIYIDGSNLVGNLQRRGWPAFIDRVQTWIGVGGSGEEGNETETGQDYYLTVLTDEEKQGEGDKSDENEG